MIKEASARVDHAYMLRDRILPDQIHVDREILMTIHADLKNIARYRAVAEFIHKTVTKHRKSFV